MCKENQVESENVQHCYCPICGAGTLGMYPCSDCITQNEDVMRLNDMFVEIGKLMNRDKCLSCGVPYDEHPAEYCIVVPDAQEMYCPICAENKIQKPQRFCSDCGEKYSILQEATSLQERTTTFCTICGEKYEDGNKEHPECIKKLQEQMKLEMGKGTY